MKRLTTEEKKIIAARIVSNGWYRPIVRYSISYDRTKEKRSTLLPYRNVFEFIQKNPDCCTLVPEEEPFGDSFEPISIRDRLWGGYSYGVIVEALTTEKISINGEPEYIDTGMSKIYLKFNNCGKCRKR